MFRNRFLLSSDRFPFVCGPFSVSGCKTKIFDVFGPIECDLSAFSDPSNGGISPMSQVYVGTT